MIRAVKNAVLARLRADVQMASSVFEGVVTTPPDRYATVFANSGVRDSGRFTGPEETAEFTFTIHSVGQTPEQAQWVAERVLAQLLNFTPLGAFRARRMRHAVSRPIALDRDGDVPLYYCVDVFDLTVDPA